MTLTLKGPNAAAARMQVAAHKHKIGLSQAASATTAPAPEKIKRDPLGCLKPGVRAAADWILATWPSAFSSPRRPLAIGSGEIIMAAKPDRINAVEVSLAIGFLVRSDEYLEALSDDQSVRFTLDGSVAGAVSEADRHSAALALWRRVTLQQRTKKPEVASY